MNDWVEKLGTVACIAMPFFNIPMIMKIHSRKSSEDVSVIWALGIWGCSVLMTPQALRSGDIAFRAFGIVNIFLFSATTFMILKYRHPTKKV